MQASPARHHSWFPVVLLAVIVPLLLVFLYYTAASVSFRLFGLSAAQATWLLLASVVGGMVNIPLTTRRIELADPMLGRMSPTMQRLVAMFHFYPPATVTVREVLAINVGGAVIPILFSAYILFRNPQVIGLAALGVVLVALAAKLLARPMPGVGIALPGFVPPIVSALVAFGAVKLLGGAADAGQMQVAVPAVAYVAGTLGTLVGADLLNLPLVLRGGLLAVHPTRVWRPGPNVPANPDKPRIVSIGGAGIFDGVFLTGILAAFLVHLL
jgi:uncharacterized membrane protein